MVTRPDAPAGRGRQLVRSPVGALADEHGIEVLTPAKGADPAFLDRLREIAPDSSDPAGAGLALSLFGLAGVGSGVERVRSAWRSSSR